MAYRTTWLATLALLATAPAAGQQSVPEPPRPPQTAAAVAKLPVVQPDIETALTFDESTRMTVPVSIGGRGPYRFLIDTGAERTVISSQVATRLGLLSAGTIKLISITGESHVPTVSIPSIEHDAGRIEKIRAPSLEQRDLGADGILGIDSLADKRILIDFRKGTMTIGSAQKREQYWGEDVIVVRAKRRYGQLILVDASADGQKVSVILDTGTQVTVGNMALRRQLERKGRVRKSIPVTIHSVTGDAIVADYSSIGHIRLGEANVTDMPVAYTDLAAFNALDLGDKPALLLGMDALALFDRVSIDFANKKARFDIPDSAPRVTPGSRLAAANDARAKLR